MPRNDDTDLESVVRAALDEAADKIVAAIVAEQQAFLASLHETLDEFEGNGATPEARGRNKEGRRRKRPPKSEWVRTADVVEVLRGVFEENPDGVRIADLRELTTYSDMQLHRGLTQLRESGEIVKEGELRKTIYRPVLRGRRRPRR